MNLDPRIPGMVRQRTWAPNHWLLVEISYKLWIESRWHRPQDVLYIGVHINHLLGSVPLVLSIHY